MIDTARFDSTPQVLLDLLETLLSVIGLLAGTPIVLLNQSLQSNNIERFVISDQNLGAFAGVTRSHDYGEQSVGQSSHRSIYKLATFLENCLV